MKPHTTVLAASLAAFLSLSGAPQGVLASDASEAYRDIEETYGVVPGFFWLFEVDTISEAWEAFKALQLNPDVGVDAKSRELIGIALASQGKCEPCLYFHVAAATANGASEAEIIAAAALVPATQRLHAAFGAIEAAPSLVARESDLVLWGDARTAERQRPTLDISLLKSDPAALD
jgi:AhpD family alkylhydroperoxidase